MSYQWGHAEEEPRPELFADQRADEQPPRRPVAAIALVVGAMAVFAGGLWFAYIQGTKHAPPTVDGGAIPLIRAEERPLKIKPDRPGGMEAPDPSNPIYAQRPGGPPVERLLPPAEQPAPRPPPPPPAPPPAQAPAAAAPPPVSAPPQSAAPSAKPAAQPKPPAEHPAPATNAKPVKLQLGSLRTPDEAREEWTRLKRQNPDLLGKLTAVAVRSDLGERGIYYRIEAGPVADAAAANRLCSELKARKYGCALVR